MSPHYLPAVIEAFFAPRKGDDGDLDRLLALFVDDALVNDQLCDFWGKQEIREWALQEVIATRLAMQIVGVRTHYEHIIVRANVTGDFDRRGLPDPFVFSFNFSITGPLICQLFIYRHVLGNRPTVSF